MTERSAVQNPLLHYAEAIGEQAESVAQAYEDRQLTTQQARWRSKRRRLR